MGLHTSTETRQKSDPNFSWTILDEKFARFDELNPHIYNLFKKFAYMLKANGRRSYGAKSIMERIRWEINVQTQGDEFKINNNFTSRYVRKLIVEDSCFEEFFQTRRIRS